MIEKVVPFNARALLVILSSLVILSCARENEEIQTNEHVGEIQESQARPNILLIIADDIGYSDLGSFGSEIKTPTLDSLAARGIRVTNFHTATKCNPTRAMLMSGVENSRSGLGPRRGYHLDPKLTTLGDAMQANGYRTYYSGKWDLGVEEELRPKARGFDRSFAMLPGAMSHYKEKPAANRGEFHYSRDGEIVEIPDDYYSTSFFTEEFVGFLEGYSDEPFFAVLSYTAPHWPLQVDEAYSTGYDEIYKSGWNSVREARLRRMRSDGIISEGMTVSDVSELPAWSDLTQAERDYEIKRMSLYAGMITFMDEQLERALGVLERNGALENTIIVFMGDNGGEGEPLKNTPVVVDFHERGGERAYNNSYDNLGRPGSYEVLGPNWARVANTPLAKWKGYALEGGISAPMLVVFPNSERGGEIEHSFVHVTDIFPTFLEAIGADPSTWPDALQGRSMLGVLNGSAAADSERSQGWFYSINADISRAVRKGDWKAVWGGEDGAQMQLYNIRDDRAETNDLSASNPDKVSELIEAWEAYAQENDIEQASQQ